jgi:hypothetical protein
MARVVRAAGMKLFSTEVVGPEDIVFLTKIRTLGSATMRDGDQTNRPLSGLPIDFGRGVARAVYLLVSQSSKSVSPLWYLQIGPEVEKMR